ncbi:MAG: hypothetical protein K9H49_13150 [Bacteroidales bacterium]|nr:hypothetical protein [Bacteroidales bacterium]MCF8390231.1 hypothetical protein [Bacteroidales bacterium]
MSSGLRKNLNIEKEELASVLILLFQSVFLGIYAGAFDVSAQSYFLDVFSADLIPKAFAYSGAVGIVITSVYSFLQSRVRFSQFAVINLLFVAVVTIALRIGFFFFDKENLVFIMLVLMGPLTIISFLGFWGTVGRIYSLRQGKRLFGIIDTGQIVGIILASYAIPVLLSFSFDILNSLYICSGSIFIALLIQVYISSRYKLTDQSEQNYPSELKEIKRNNFLDLFRNKYTMLMVSFVVLSVLAAFFIHYSFLVVTETNFPEPTTLASFLGVFMGTVMVFSLILKTFVFNRLMKTYGLKLALTIAPVILGIFVVGAILVGKFYGFSASSSGFTLFFLLIVSGKLFSKSLKDSVEVPSSKILYQSLDSKIRYGVQSRIDGTVNEIAALSAGLLLVSLALVQTFNIMHFSYVLAIILSLWITIAFFLHRAYKVSLSNALIKFKQTEAKKSDGVKLNERVVSESDSSVSLENILEFAPQAWNGFITRNLKPLLLGNEKLRTITLDWISRLNISESRDILIEMEKSGEFGSKTSFSTLLNRFRLREDKLSFKDIGQLAQSGVKVDRLNAVLAIGNSMDDQTQIYLPLLLKDNDPDVRISSIRLVGSRKFIYFAPALIELLDHKTYYPFAFNSLGAMVNEVLDKLDQAFYKTHASEKLMIRIIRLMSMAEAELAIPYLKTKLDQHLANIHIESFKALEKLNYIPDTQFSQRLMEHILMLTGVTAWNISVRQSLKESSFSDELIDAFEEEINNSYDQIFLTLSLLYDSKTIAQIKANFETGSGESIGYSLELLDLFVDENIKANLFTILEFSKESSKIHNLQSEFPVEILYGEKILHAIMNRDYNYLNTYTLILAIKETTKLEGYQADNNLIAHLFNANFVVAETACRQLYFLDRRLLLSVLPRLEKQKRIRLEESISVWGEGKISDYSDSFEILKSSSLSEIISNTNLFKISGLFQQIDLKKEIDAVIKTSKTKDFFLYFAAGNIKIKTKVKQNLIKAGEFNCIKIDDSEASNDISFSSDETNTLLVLKAEDLKELIFDYEEIFIDVPGILLGNQSTDPLIKR